MNGMNGSGKEDIQVIMMFRAVEARGPGSLRWGDVNADESVHIM